MSTTPSTTRPQLANHLVGVGFGAERPKDALNLFPSEPPMGVGKRDVV